MRKSLHVPSLTISLSPKRSISCIFSWFLSGLLLFHPEDLLNNAKSNKIFNLFLIEKWRNTVKWCETARYEKHMNNIRIYVCKHRCCATRWSLLNREKKNTNIATHIAICIRNILHIIHMIRLVLFAYALDFVPLLTGFACGNRLLVYQLYCTMYILVFFFPYETAICLLRLRFPDCFQLFYIVVVVTLFLLTMNLCRQQRVFAWFYTSLWYNGTTHSIIPIQSENRTLNWTRFFNVELSVLVYG